MGTIRIAARTRVALPLGGLWRVDVVTRDDDGYLVGDAPVATITLPGGTTSTPAATLVETGLYRFEYTAGTAGRYLIRIVNEATSDVATATVWVSATVGSTQMPDIAEVRGYLDEESEQWTDEQLQPVMDAEAAAQRGLVRMPAEYPADLRWAYLRRVQVALAAKAFTTMMRTGDAENGTLAPIPGRDPIVRQYERPHRKLVLG